MSNYNELFEPYQGQYDSICFFNGSSLTTEERHGFAEVSKYVFVIKPIITHNLKGPRGLGRDPTRTVSEIAAKWITDGKYYVIIYKEDKIMREAAPYELINARNIHHLKVITDEKTIAILKEIEAETARFRKFAEAIEGEKPKLMKPLKRIEGDKDRFKNLIFHKQTN